MVLEVIYLVRHGFRATWVLDAETGAYTSRVPTPTGIPADVPLVSYGEDQARQLAEHLVTLDPPIDRVYSSPYTRCLQTLAPAVAKVRGQAEGQRRGLWNGEVRGENGFGEWYGQTAFKHPSPAPPEKLHELFPFYTLRYTPVLYPATSGETIEELYERVAYVLASVIADLDADPERPKSVLICTHAATLIALGRVLTGHVPADPEEQDFKPFTAGVSVFVRRRTQRRLVSAGGKAAEVAGDVEDVVSGKEENKENVDGHADATGRLVAQKRGGEGSPLPIKMDWRHGKGVKDGWDCVKNGDCSFLRGGEERGWKFGDP